jgi:putative ABC transport system permease protein
MLELRLLLVFNEGLTFGIFALGIYLAFQWLKFPDLTPDGSFIIGPIVFVKLCMIGTPMLISILVGILSGFILGVFTASMNKLLKVPSIIAGLITSTASYSIGWIILNKPNQNLVNESEFFSSSLYNNSIYLFILLILTVLIIILLFQILGNSIWGLRLRAIGENNLLSKDLNLSEKKYFVIGLGLANSLVALSGILFIQRSYSVDINMGIGQTITGLIAMILGLILIMKSRRIWLSVLMIIVGAVIHKAIILITLELGFPAESFRLVSAILIIALFVVMKKLDTNLLKGLKWT